MATFVQTSETQIAIRDAAVNALTTIRDRIYISEDVRRLNIYKLRRDAAREFEHDHVYTGTSPKFIIRS
jgi:hypothetical protein